MSKVRMLLRERWNDGGILDSAVRLESFVFTRCARKPIARPVVCKNELVLQLLS